MCAANTLLLSPPPSSSYILNNCWIPFVFHTMQLPYKEPLFRKRQETWSVYVQYRCSILKTAFINSWRASYNIFGLHTLLTSLPNSSQIHFPPTHPSQLHVSFSLLHYNPLSNLCCPKSHGHWAIHWSMVNFASAMPLEKSPSIINCP